MIALGSLRMDKGEDMSYAFEAIERMREAGVTTYGFDVVYVDPSQKKRAHRFMKIIEKRIRERIPMVELYTGVTDDPMERPGAFEIAKIVVESGAVPEMVDINPDREKDWNG